MCVSHSRGATYQINAVHYFLKCTAKVQNKMLPTKRFLDLVLFVNKYYLYQKEPN